MTTISLPNPLLTALREGRLLVVWGDVPWKPESGRNVSRGAIRTRWKGAVGRLGAIALPLHGLPPLRMLSLDPTGRIIEAFERAQVPLQVIRRRGEVPMVGQHELLMLGGELATETGLLLTWEEVAHVSQHREKAYLLGLAKEACEGGAILVVVPKGSHAFARIWYNRLASHFTGIATYGVSTYGVGSGSLPANVTQLEGTPNEVLQALREAVLQDVPSDEPFPDEIRPTIGIITALPKEEAAVKAMLLRASGQKAYTVGLIPARGGGYHHVVHLQAGMGTNIAAADAAFMLCDYPEIKDLIMVGIAGGVPHPEKADEHVRLGDIVVLGQKGVIQYDLDKESYQGIEHRHYPFPPSSRLLQVVKRLAANELHGERPWLTHIARANTLSNATRPATHSDKLAATNNPSHFIAHPNDPNRTANQPRIFIAPIASGNKLLKNPKTRDYLRDQFSVKAIEMEAAGIAHAAWRRNVGYMVIRGICDYCDSHKNDDWQGYAAVVAAAYMRAMLEALEAVRRGR